MSSETLMLDLSSVPIIYRPPELRDGECIKT